ncbi:MAG: hypothetical protein A2W90_02425 [Bacteroidetes bacterium GWF2_42_66]|nr:MAG: hypothetical protein A2W92_08500 [Bacteroidetes bacterium GWA2_42_15]OFY01206.1 MAG: hypothetical protein A2W89_15910 [Bacteroidetes bacterium GWE2_42_39]OFY42049.1 MAG: hypothetical protein A2W90_02425 [Bacteroidetes bacterium GWF2_42_66]HBL77748.1 hypothetical protein [Prolixibacteraceae bacterium]HCB62877.1 hypothetical protein [Bacteroidales bacterium]
MPETSIIIVAILLFILFRELFTWYLKQNKIVEQNDEIIRLLKKIANEPREFKDSKWWQIWK